MINSIYQWPGWLKSCLLVSLIFVITNSRKTWGQEMQPPEATPNQTQDADQDVTMLKPLIFIDNERVIALGDSLTDGDTWPILVATALRQARLPTPRFINAGIGGDTSAGMLQRLERDVYIYKPSMVILNVGANDAGYLSPEQYRTNLEQLFKDFRQHDIDVMALTITPGRNSRPGGKRKIFNDVLRDVTRQFNFRIAETGAELERGAVAGEDLWESDGAHLSAPGYFRYARAILDGLGYPEVAVPDEIPAPEVPGLVKNWKIHPLDKDETPDPAAAPSQQGANLTLPDPRPAASWWPDQERRRGYAIELDKKFVPASRYAAFTELPPAQKATTLFLLGAEVYRVWINGELVFTRPAPEKYQGWHVGGYRFTAALKTDAPNQILMETGSAFCLALAEPII